MVADLVRGRSRAALDTAHSAQTTNSLEAMLCHQMAAAHHAGMKVLATSLVPALPAVEQSRLTNASARMMQICQEAMLTLQKLRTGGKQTVIVQHVSVSSGGQAVVAGNLKTKSQRAQGWAGLTKWPKHRMDNDVAG